MIDLRAVQFDSETFGCHSDPTLPLENTDFQIIHQNANLSDCVLHSIEPNNKFFKQRYKSPIMHLVNIVLSVWEDEISMPFINTDIELCESSDTLGIFLPQLVLRFFTLHKYWHFGTRMFLH